MQKKIDDMKLLKYKNTVNCKIRDIVMSNL